MMLFSWMRSPQSKRMESDRGRSARAKEDWILRGQSGIIANPISISISKYQPNRVHLKSCCLEENFSNLLLEGSLKPFLPSIPSTMATTVGLTSNSFQHQSAMATSISVYVPWSRPLSHGQYDPNVSRMMQMWTVLIDFQLQTHFTEILRLALVQTVFLNQKNTCSSCLHRYLRSKLLICMWLLEEA